MDYIVATEQAMVEAAQNLAPELHDKDILLLYGPLGAGKTVFARSLIRALTGNPHMEVPSPTFTLVQSYDSAKGPLWHYDLYRIEDPEDIYALGWEDSLAEGITIVEWPERLGPLKPPSALDIHISTMDNKPTHRKIRINKS